MSGPRLFPWPLPRSCWRWVFAWVGCWIMAAQAAWQTGDVPAEAKLRLTGSPVTLALARDARLLAVGRDLPAAVVLLQPDSGATLATLPLAARPLALALDASGRRLFLLRQGSGHVTVVNISPGGSPVTVAAEWPVSGQPVDLALDTDTGWLYVADQQGRVLVLDSANGNTVRTVAMGAGPKRLALARGGKLLVGTQSGQLITLDTAHFTTLSQIDLSAELTGLDWWNTGSLALVLPRHLDQWRLLDPLRGSTTASGAVEGRPGELAIDQHADDAYVTTIEDLSVNRLNLTRQLIAGRHRLGDTPGDVIFDPVARQLYIALPLEGALLRLDPLQARWESPLAMRTRHREVAVHQDKDQAFAVTERQGGLLTRWRLSDRLRGVLPLRAAARRLAVDSINNLAVIGVNTPGHEVIFVDLAPANPALLSGKVNVGGEIQSIVVDPVGRRSVVLVDDARGIRLINNQTRQQTAALSTPETFRLAAMHASAGKVYLLGDTRRLAVLDLNSQQLSQPLELDFHPGGLALDEGLNLAVITSPLDNSLRILDLSRMQFIRSVTLPKHPGSVAIHPELHLAVVASKESNSLTLVDLLDDSQPPQALPAVERPIGLALAHRLNQALVLSGEKDDLFFIGIPYPKPVLERLSPTEIASGSPGFTLTAQGKRFTRQSTLLWNGNALVTRFVSPNRLQAEVPATLLQSAGEATVRVRTPGPGGGDSEGLRFSVTAPVPVLTAVSPTQLLANGTDQTLTLTGNHFRPESRVHFGFNPVNTSYVSNSRLLATVPGGLLLTPALVPVTVVTPMGGASAAINVEVKSAEPDLAISSLEPPSGEPGTQVVITGTGFNPDASRNTVRFGGNAQAPVTQASPTRLTVVVPATAMTGPISVSNGRQTVTGPVFTVVRSQDFSLLATPSSVQLLQNASTSLSVQLASSGTEPFTGLARLTISGLPSGVTASFEPASLTGSQPGTLRLRSTANANTGFYPVTLTATALVSGVQQTRTATINLQVQTNTGVTGVKGRFVNPNGEGIAGVLVAYDNLNTRSDSAGNFILTGLPAGEVTLRFDATPANPLYPIWPSTVTLVRDQITVLEDWVIHPPPPAERFKTFTESNQDQVITDPRYPGLEITIPAGTSIIGWDGVKKNRMAVEKLEPDRLPIAPPPVATGSVYQLYFGTAMGGIPSNPIPVTLPNDLGLEPGTRTQLWYYDGSPMGGDGEWKTGGWGRVSADGSVIVTEPGSGIPRFCGVCGMPCFADNQAKQPSQPPSTGLPNQTPTNDDHSPAGNTCNPVTLATGIKFPQELDLHVSSNPDLTVRRVYNQYDPYNGIAGAVFSMGLNWVLSYDITLMTDFVFNDNSNAQRLVLPGNSRVDFRTDGRGGFVNDDDPRFSGAVLRRDGQHWLLTFKDGTVWRFAAFGVAGLRYLVEQRDPSGNVLSLERLSDGKLHVATSGGRKLQFRYGSHGLLSEVVDDLGRRVHYTYTNNRIETVTAPDGGVTRYTYESGTGLRGGEVCRLRLGNQTEDIQPQIPESYRLKTIQYPGRQPITINYGTSGRVLRQVLEDSRELFFSYKLLGACQVGLDNQITILPAHNDVLIESWDHYQAGQRLVLPGRVLETTISDSLGNRKTYRFNTKGMITEIIDALGQKTVFTYDNANRVEAITDPIGRITRYRYDAKGNRDRIIDPDGRITDLTYDPKWNYVTSITRYLDNNEPVTLRFEYDNRSGVLTRAIDPLGNTIELGYAGNLLKTVTDALGNIYSLDYNEQGDLIRIRDPLGHETLLARDAVGRATRQTDPLGATTITAFNAIDQVETMTDALGGVTRFDYHPDRSLAAVVDPLNRAVERYQYDNAGRPLRQLDVKGKAVEFSYDTAGRLIAKTDRMGRETQIQRDELGRVIRVERPDGAVVELTYDAAGRIIQLNETGVQQPTYYEFSYDNRDLLVREVIRQFGQTHVLTYRYDALGRRIERKVNGADTTTYAYDKAGRLTRIRFNNEPPITYEWDRINRLTAKVLGNGVRMEYQYDAASRLTRITYRRPNGSELGHIAYGYDAKGQRISRTMSFPSRDETPMVASYDEANRLVSFTLTATGETFDLAYDDNGNLVSKTSRLTGETTRYTWDVMDRLIAISGPGINASFIYDALGRRIGKTVNGQMVQYLYDGDQYIAEIRSGNVDARLLTGLQLDEVLARYTQTGARHYLTDAISSVMALLKDDVSMQNRYAYSPYGESTPDGIDEGNTIEFTSRENDDVGVLYYRARYYDPEAKRFIADDPVGIVGGVNAYSYVFGNPLSYVDPTGEIVPLVVAGAVLGGVINAAIYTAVNGFGSSKCFTPAGLAGAIIGGALAGGLGTIATPLAASLGLGGGVLGTAIVNSLIGATSGAISAALDPCQDITPEYLLMSAISGAAGGALGNRLFPTQGMSNFRQVGFPRTWQGVTPQLLGGTAGPNAMNAIYYGGTVSATVGAIMPIAADRIIP